MKIMIIGADGQLGSELCNVIPREEQIKLILQDLDITDRQRAFELIEKFDPEVVINTAACNNVDGCEDDPGPAFAVNTAALKNLADACRAMDACLVHFSTDYVFDGQKRSPYVETDPPNPRSVYAVSKLAGELIVRSSLDKYFIVRTAGLYGAAGCMGKNGANFVEGMLRRAAKGEELRVVTDEVLSPTYALDLARKVEQLVRTKHYGLYHIANRGQCSWYEFACKIFELLGRKVTIQKTTAAEFKARAKRPGYSVLRNAGLEKIGLDDMRPWQEALRAYLVEKEHLN